MNFFINFIVISKLKRLKNTVHYMVKKNVPIHHPEDLGMLQKANGCDLDDQYLSKCGFYEFLESLDDIIIYEDIKKKLWKLGNCLPCCVCYFFIFKLAV